MPESNEISLDVTLYGTAVHNFATPEQQQEFLRAHRDGLVSVPTSFTLTFEYADEFGDRRSVDITFQRDSPDDALSLNDLEADR